MPAALTTLRLESLCGVRTKRSPTYLIVTLLLSLLLKKFFLI